MLLEQTDVDVSELESLRSMDAVVRTGSANFVDETLELSEDGLHVGYGGLNSNLAELASAVSKENAGQGSVFDGELELTRIPHIKCTT